MNYTESNTCTMFRLSTNTINQGYNCGKVFDVYSQELIVSTVFLCTVAISCLLLASLTWYMVCCNCTTSIPETAFEKRLDYIAGNERSSMINDNRGSIAGGGGVDIRNGGSVASRQVF